MGMFSHLGGIALGTVKEGPNKNMGAVVVAQSFLVAFAADGTVTAGCKLPAGATITDIHLDVRVAFNAATTNTIKVGTTSGGAELVTATTVNAIGRPPISGTAAPVNWEIGSTGATIYATYNQTGTAASAGSARVTVLYAVKNADATIVNPA